MIVRREKIRKELHRSSMEVFYKQNDMVLDEHEDWSGEKLDFLRHRSTRFTDFSENYVTERLWKKENGKTDTIFDTTIEDDEELMNTSQIEKFDENDLVRDSQMCQHSSNRSTRASSPKLERSNSHDNAMTSQRNIFEFFKKESKPIIETLNNRNASDTSSASKRLDFSDKKDEFVVLDEEIRLKLPADRVKNQTIDDEKLQSCFNDEDVSFKTLKIDEDTTTTIDENECKNAFENLESLVDDEERVNYTDEASTSSAESSMHNNKNVKSDEEETARQNGGKNSTTGIDNVFRPSSLLRKGKKRFRNLPPADETQRRNSPRLNKVIEETFEEANNTYEAPIAKLKSLVSESKKRRRLNSCGDFIGGENGDEQPDYVRITRSRLSSCT